MAKKEGAKQARSGSNVQQVADSMLARNHPENHEEEEFTTSPDEGDPAASEATSSEENEPREKEEATPQEPSHPLSVQQTNANVAISREGTRRVMAEAAHQVEPDDAAPDVLLDVPSLKVDRIKLTVEKLDAQVALRASVANLVHLDVGAQALIEKVDLEIEGVEAQAFLKVRLKRVQQILARALESIDRNPDLLDVLEPVGHSVEKVGGAAEDAVEGVSNQPRGVIGGAFSAAQRARKAVRLNPGRQAGHQLKEIAKGVVGREGLIDNALAHNNPSLDDSILGRYHVKERLRHYLYRQDQEAEGSRP